MAKVQKSEAEWRDELTPEQFRVLRKHGTEPSHTSVESHRRAWIVFLCWLWSIPISHGHEIRKRHRLAEFLCTGQ